MCVLLVLSRHKNEAVMVGDEIRVVVIEIRGDKVRLGFEAPNHVQVHRDEVYAAITGQPKPDRKRRGNVLPGGAPHATEAAPGAAEAGE
jgi:carbon storage regulator